jgi:topoisomerase IA-like protein
VLKKLEEDGTVSFKSIRKNVEIDMEKLKSGGYTVDELIERDINLGVYDGETLLLKNGKFGPYVECGDKKISIKTLVKSFDKIEYADVLPYLQAAFEKECVATSAGPKSPTSAMKMGNTSVLRIITNNLSIRKGKFGPYLFYQTQYMNKPQFLNLKKFPDNYHNCSPETIVAWVKQTYEVDA